MTKRTPSSLPRCRTGLSFSGNSQPTCVCHQLINRTKILAALCHHARATGPVMFGSPGHVSPQLATTSSAVVPPELAVSQCKRPAQFTKDCTRAEPSSTAQPGQAGMPPPCPTHVTTIGCSRATGLTAGAPSGPTHRRRCESPALPSRSHPTRTATSMWARTARVSTRLA